jgi:tripartite ATP-independent transporter DctP family solute receptor
MFEIRQPGRRRILAAALCGTFLALSAGGFGAQAAELELKFAHNLAPTEPFNVAAEAFAKAVAERSGGAISVTVFPSEQLGPNKEMLELAKQGANIITLTDAGYLADFVPDVGVMQGPYLIGTVAEFDKLLQSDLYAEWVAQAKTAGMMPLAFNWYIGSRHVIADRPIRTVKDFEGLTIRVPPIQMYIRTFEALGARPVTLQWSEVYTGLSQGVVDAAEAPLPTIYSNKLNEVRQVVSLTGHFAAFLGITMSATLFDSLPAEQQTILLEEAAKAGQLLIELTEARVASVQDELRAAGVEIVEITDLAGFQEATAGVYATFDNWTPGLYDRVRTILGR